MTRLLRAALVIARRDFVATVVSRSFVLFLIGPLIAAAFALTIGRVTDQSDKAALKPVLVVLADPIEAQQLPLRYRRIEAAVGGELPTLRVEPVRGDPARQAARLVGERTAVLARLGGAFHLFGAPPTLDAVGGLADLLVGGASGPPAAITRVTLGGGARGDGTIERHLLARAGQTLLFMLTVLLAGMLLSNLVEEKSNKVIEVLASAVPVDAIFLGKLIAMLGVSMTGIVLWGSLLAGAAAAFIPAGTAFPVPAIGWPTYLVLLLLYYVMNYMILGGAFLGIGAQAASVREVQTLSMPATMAQLAIFALAATAVGDLTRPLVTFASIFPPSSPLTMIARAAQSAVLWPHLLALAWQALWVVVIVRFAAQRFRRGVLKSGAPANPRKAR